MSLLGFLGKTAAGFLTGGVGGAIAAGTSELLKPKAAAAPGSAPTSSLLNAITASRQVTGRFVNTTSPVLRPQVNLIGTPPLVGPGMPPMLPDSSKVSGVSLGGLTIGTRTNYYPAAGGTTGAPAQNGAGCGKGFHPNKTGYFTAQGYVAPGSRCVKNRRRNPLNPRALSRSIARISSAKNAAKFLSRVSVRPKEGCGCK